MPISQALQGPYVYLLIFQILIVSSLLLFLLWLIVHRMRLQMAEAQVSVPPPVIIQETLVASSPGFEELQAKFNLTVEENTGLKRKLDESKDLFDKIKFLESKLLEYEILQEEIGLLSTLKVENEKLKTQLMALQKSGVKVALPPPATKPLVSKAIVAEPTPEEPPALSQAGIDALISGGESPEEASVPKPDPTPGTTDDAALNGLLTQIDQLPQNKPK